MPLDEFERYTLGYVDNYLHDGQRMLRRAKALRSQLLQDPQALRRGRWVKLSSEWLKLSVPQPDIGIGRLHAAGRVTLEGRAPRGPQTDRPVGGDHWRTPPGCPA